MNKQLLIQSALASALALGIAAAPVVAQEKEKCYGVAKAGQNDCANLAGTHSCAGLAKTDNAAGEWKYVAKGSCKSMGGMSATEAQAKK